MDDCIDLLYILLSRILFAIPEKNSPLIFLVAAMKDSPPPGCRAFSHIAINLFLINNLHLQKTVATFRSSVFAEPAFCGYSPIFFLALNFLSLPTTLAVNRVLLCICSASFCNGPSFRRLPPFLLVQRFFVCYIPKTTTMRCAVLFCQRLTCRRPPLLLGNLALATPPPRELLPRNRPGKALLGGCCSI